MKRRDFLKTLGFGASCLSLNGLGCFSGDAQKSSSKPNIIIVLVDDMGWADIGVNGNKYYETPNIDRLAAEGINFTNGYAACAVCSPTRAAVLTGRYPTRHGITDWIRPSQATVQPDGYEEHDPLLTPKNHSFMELDEVTIAEILKSAGYATCHVGKWHLGGTKFYPTAQGFDHNIGGCAFGQPQGGKYFDPYGIPTLTDRKTGEYLTDREADEAVTFIGNAVSEGKPFFLYMPHYAVHVPIQAKTNLIDYYKSKPIPTGRDYHPEYAAMVHSVDDAMGTIRKKIDELNVSGNTIIIFTSDNGGLVLPWDKGGKNIWTDNYPLRSGKGFPYEGGIREPFIVCWPGVIPKGSVCDIPVCSIDLLPTICQITGSPLPADRIIDGLSILPLLTKKTDSLDRTDLFWHYPHYWEGVAASKPYSIIRSGDWKLIRYYQPQEMELYNLKDDISEKNNLAEKYPQKVKELDEKLAGWLKETGAKLPKQNPNYVNKKKQRSTYGCKNSKTDIITVSAPPVSAVQHIKITIPGNAGF